MRSNGVKRLWTHPELPMPEAYGRMSYALFRTDGDVGRVVASRAPDSRYLRVGDYVQDDLSFCEDAMAYVVSRHDEAPPLFILTDAGIGLLSGKYHLSAGLGLYLHIHTRPSSAARLINNGALGLNGGFAVSREIRGRGSMLTARDSRSYPALLEAWQTVVSAPRRVFETSLDDSLSLGDLRHGIGAMAAFAGCDVTFTTAVRKGASAVSPHTRVKCYRPLLTEGILLCLLSEMRERSATGGGVCRLELHPNGGNGLTLTLRYPVRPQEPLQTAELYDAIHGYLADAGETWGLDLYAPAHRLSSRYADGLPEATVTLDWLLDPAVLSTSDIKARLALAREEEREGEPDPVEEVPFDPVFE